MTRSVSPVAARSAVEEALSAAHASAHLGAFVALDASGARAAAEAADSDGAPRGPLHGTPTAIKDNLDVAGFPSLAGSPLLPDRVARSDSTAVARLRAAGAIVLGKTAMHELAYGPTGDRSASGPVRNPHAADRMAGGSSGGSAAAVAAGVVPVALGTDTGGSVRIPAALCGVVGFKPAHGAIPVDGVFPLARTLDHVGVIAATVSQCAAAAGVLTGRAPASAPLPRIAWLSTDAWTPGDPRVSRVARAALPGHSDARLDGSAAWHDAVTSIQGAEAYALHADRVECAADRFDPEVLARLRAGSRVPAWRYVRARATRRAAIADAATLLEGPTVLASPTVAVVAPHLGRRWIVVDGHRVRVPRTLLALTCPWNLVGFPAITVPAGTVDGLPVGVQLICSPGQEDALFAAAKAVEARGQQ